MTALDTLAQRYGASLAWRKRGHRADVIRWLLDVAERSGLTEDDFRRNDCIIVPPNH